MNFNEYQDATDKTAIYPKDFSLEYLGFGLCSEAGEVAGKLKKLIRDYPVTWDAGFEGFNRETQLAIADELGDVLWYVAQLAGVVGCSLEYIADINIDKLTSRKERDTLGGSGDNR